MTAIHRKVKGPTAKRRAAKAGRTKAAERDLMNQVRQRIN